MRINVSLKIFHCISSYIFSFALVVKQKLYWKLMKFGAQSKNILFLS